MTLTVDSVRKSVVADVFISYSRRDKEFVSRLHDRLEASGRSTWVDWEGIPPSAEWLREIYAAIEAGDAFLFVISGHSVVSQVCAAEIAHAVKHHKRLIPVSAAQKVADDAGARGDPRTQLKLDLLLTAMKVLMAAMRHSSSHSTPISIGSRRTRAC